VCLFSEHSVLVVVVVVWRGRRLSWPWRLVIYQDGSLSPDPHTNQLIATQLGVRPTTWWSLVKHLNHYTTEVTWVTVTFAKLADWPKLSEFSWAAVEGGVILFLCYVTVWHSLVRIICVFCSAREQHDDVSQGKKLTALPMFGRIKASAIVKPAPAESHVNCHFFTFLLSGILLSNFSWLVMFKFVLID